MLQNDFFTVADYNAAADSIQCRLAFRQDHSIFEGHFPIRPVVPGVCSMQIVKELLERELSKLLILTGAPQVKFLQLILPESSPRVMINWRMDGDDYIVTANFMSADGAMFKMQGRYQQG